MFNEWASWYSLPTSDSILITQDEASEHKMICEDEEEDIGTLEESPISFRMSDPNEELGWND